MPAAPNPLWAGFAKVEEAGEGDLDLGGGGGNRSEDTVAVDASLVLPAP